MDKMKPEKIDQFYNQYPALREVLEKRPLLDSDPTVPTNIYIRVERMDGNLLFFNGQGITGQGHYLCRINDAETLNGTRLERVYIVENKQKIVARKLWGPKGIGRVKDLFSEYEIQVDQVAYAIKDVTHEWYEAVEEDPCPFGELKVREKEITIYRLPKIGLSKLLQRARVDQHVALSTQRFMRAMLNKEPEFLEVSKKIDEMIEAFVIHVYNCGLRSRIDRSQSAGMSGQFGSVTIRSFVSGGRVMLTLERGKDQITFIVAEDGEPRMGLQSIEATFPSAKSIVDAVIAEFADELSMAYDNLKDDESVSIV